ncbi:TldD/PmbA family protein [Ignisphaera sp. 4213-co]|uniref:TldD/PmbA family protein n=1 Tax=Ignisphaera cupida TaxID=3050454 RepID=A0ABD4Z483_9CREN|nr:TldD/PmbA family protein [Ignisphaera sp. 4213-co]MDK6028126.1 TldD/PmbA family protein [Ignisphaera sp. 4213-co]
MSVEISIDLGKEVLERVLRRNVDEAVIRLQERVYELIVFDNGVLRSYGVSRVVGIGIQVFVNGFTGYSYTSSLSRESIESAIDRAVKSARTLALVAKPRKFAEVSNVKGFYKTSYSENPFSVDSSEKISLIKELNINAMKKPGIVSALTRLGCERDRRVIVSSKGIEVFNEVTMVGLSHMAVAKSGEIMERVYDQKTFVGGYEKIRSFDWMSFVDEVNDLAVKASMASAPKAGVYRAVVDNELIGLLLHEAFGHASEGDSVLYNVSVLKGRVGEKVASESVTIVDDGSVEGGYPIHYDDEGAEKKKTVIVDKGILKTFLSSRYVAGELGIGLTGNARAQDITFNAIVRQTNFYMLPGDAKVDELFEGISEGIYLRGRGAMGGQVDPSMGTFTFNVGPSYIIKNGEIEKLVRGVTVSGNILDVLKNVELVANDLKVSTSVFGGCGKASQLVRVGDGGPHIRVSKIVVGGE